MLSILRKKAASWMIRAVFGVVVAAFVGTIFLVWGVQKGGPLREDKILSINGFPITLKDYQEAYNNQWKRWQEANLPPEFIEKLNLKYRVIEDLITGRLLLEAAQRNHLRVTDEQLRQAIWGIDVFKRNDRFDRNLYLTILRASNLSVEKFEENLRLELLVFQITSLIKDSVQITEADTFDSFIREKEEVNMDYLKISSEDYIEKVKVEDKTVEEYFQKHREEFRVSEKVKVKFLFLDPKEFREKVKLKDKELKEYYETHREEYKQEYQIKAKHILIKVEKEAPLDHAEKARKTAEEIREKLIKGESFEELAKKFSQDEATAAQGGDLGYFRKGDTVKPFEDSVFKLKKGEISDIVRTDFGFHIIKVEDIIEEGLQPFERVKESIKDKLEVEKSFDVAYEEAQNIYEILFAGKDMADLSKKNNLKVEETDFFSRNEGLVRGLEEPMLIESAFGLGKDEISEVIETKKGYYILKLMDKRASYIPKLEEVKEKAQKALRYSRAQDIAKQEAEKILEEIKKGKKFEELIQKRKMEIKETGLFNRSTTYIPEIKNVGELKKIAFSLKEKGFPHNGVTKTNGDFILIRLKDRRVPTLDEFKKEGKDFARKFLTKKREEIFESFLKSLRNQAKIEYYMNLEEL